MTSTEQAPLTTETNDELIEDAMATVKPSDEIEAVLAGLAEDQKVMVATSEAGKVWQFEYGSVEVFVQLTGETDEDTLTVWASVLKFPVKNENLLMRRLLEMNWLSTLESHFAIVNDQVVVLSSRTLADISASEISRIITIVATIADNNDDQLQAEFGL
ncbi:YbjN domain-containing protein [Planktothrix sp. FACHB-1365]|uniref:YbjN domain-containing protein n=1 Tax=Planktothrix sp. FACHB-1365 TaxID=2692855 RepID=UPI001684C070|nr:YbjN domain-containing protein [Planktothrix sp. FACHB-1365]MBD2485674.1 YbjN domain-containing protein [Planktothrix sp. FACHB-1365]